MRALLSGLCLLLLAAASPAGAQDGLDCTDPQTQHDMNMCAELDFEAADRELNQVWKLARAAMQKTDADLAESQPDLVGADKALLKAQRAWIDYRDGQCEAAGFEMRGGSMEPLVVAGCKTSLTKARIAELRALLGTGE